MHKKLLSVLACAIAVLAVSVTAADAKVLQVTGKSTSITPSAQAAHFLANHNITVSAVGPATVSNGTLTLPITGGRFHPDTLNARILHSGGVQFTHGKRSLTLSDFVLTHRGHRTFLWAHSRHGLIRVAKLTQQHLTISGKTGTLTGELRLSRAAAHAINKLFRHHIVSAGADLGSLTSTVTVA